MKRKPILHRPTKEKRRTPPSVYEQVCVRAGGTWANGECVGGGKCEKCGTTKGPFEFAHYGKHRKLGGTTDPAVHSAKNIKRICRACHDKKDRRTMPKSKPIDKPGMRAMGQRGLQTYWKEQQLGIKPKKKG